VIQNFFFEEIMSVEEQNMPLMHLTHTSEQRSCFRIFWRPEQQLSTKKSLKMQLLLISMGDLSLSGLMRLRDRRSEKMSCHSKITEHCPAVCGEKVMVRKM
jgi:hypothetical protein